MSHTNRQVLGSSDLSNQGHICTKLCVKEGSEDEWFHVERPVAYTGKENGYVYVNGLDGLGGSPVVDGTVAGNSGCE